MNTAFRVSNPEVQNQSPNQGLAQTACNSLKMFQTANSQSAQNLLRRISHPQINCVRLTYGHRNSLKQLNYRETRESTNSLNRLDYNESLEPDNWLILLNSVDSPESGEHEQYSCSAFIRAECIEGNQHIAELHDSRKPHLVYEQNQQINQPSLRGAVNRVEFYGSFVKPDAGATYENFVGEEPTHTKSVGHSSIGKIPVQCLEKKRYIQNETTITTIRTVCHGFSISLTPSKGCDQPFGSIPRAFSSLRITLLSHAEIDSSPSISIACFMAFAKPGSTLNAICLLPRGNFVFDTCYTSSLSCLCLTMYNTFKAFVKQQSPAVLAALTGLLTKPLSEVTVMAEQQHTQTHPKFTWRFLALSVTENSIVHITAATEREAREQSPAGCVMVFAGRLPAQEVRHAQ